MPNEVRIVVTGDDRASKVLDDVARKASGLGKVFSGMGQVAGGVLLAQGVTQLQRLGTSAVSTGINFLAMKEMAHVTFTTMLKDAEQASSLLNQLQDFAAKTPFEFPQLLHAAENLKAMGFGAKDIIPVLTDIGDAARGVPEKIDRIAIAFGQIMTRGKVAGTEMMQLTEAGISAWRFLAEAVGVTEAEIVKMVEAGKISAETGIKAMRAGIQREMGGLMTATENTWTGIVSTLKDNYRQVLGDVLQPLFETLKGQMQNLRDTNFQPLTLALLGVQLGFIGIARTVRDAASEVLTFFDNVQNNGVFKFLTETKIENPGAALARALGLGGTEKAGESTGGGGGAWGPAAPDFFDEWETNIHKQIEAIKNQTGAQAELTDETKYAKPPVASLTDELGKLRDRASELFSQDTREETRLRLEIAKAELMGRKEFAEQLRADLEVMQQFNEVQRLRLQLADPALMLESEQNRMTEVLIGSMGGLVSMQDRAAASIMGIDQASIIASRSLTNFWGQTQSFTSTPIYNPYAGMYDPYTNPGGSRGAVSGRSFHSGTSFVPEDNWYYLQRAERVIPAAENLGMSRSSGGSGAVSVIVNNYGPINARDADDARRSLSDAGYGLVQGLQSRGVAAVRA